MIESRSKLPIAISALAIVLLLAGVVRVWNDPGLSWDTRMLRAAAVAHSLALDPYETGNLGRVTGREMPWPYVYPPLTLWAVRPLAMLSETGAVRVMICIKLAAVVGLFAVWCRFFIEPKQRAIFPVFALFAFQSPIWADIATGNISTFEQLLLWGGFVFWMSKRDAAFAACVLGASLFKFVMLAFLVLLVIRRTPRSMAILVTSVAWFLAWVGVNAYMSPGMFHGYLENVRGLDAPWERGEINPSMFALLKELTSGWPGAIATIGYGLIAAGVVYVCHRTIRVIRLRATPDADRLTVCLCCLAYALLMPRMKDYSYMLLLVPAWVTLTRASFASRPIAVAVLLCLPSTPARSLPGLEAVFALLESYYPLVCAAVLWGYFCYGMIDRSSRMTFAAPHRLERVSNPPVPQPRAA